MGRLLVRETRNTRETRNSVQMSLAVTLHNVFLFANVLRLYLLVLQTLLLI